MATTTRFSINGLVDTKQSALTNLDQIATSAGAWLTFDNQSGTWSVVINQAGNSVSSFNNSNILNGIRMNGAGLRDLYNGVKVNYPRTDIRDNTDFVQIELPPADRNANEVDNLLEMTLPMVSTQVQAQLIGFRELKQSRVDRIVEFETDYTKIGLKAGDLIDITNTALGMTNELYRITNIVELDDVERGLTFKITALQYDADVYNEDDLVEYTITTENGIYTAGDIAQPPVPSITKYEKNGRPRLEIETTVPAGRVEAMEYWLATGNSTADYSLVGTQKSTTVGVLTEGSEIVLDLDNINAANVFVKTRGINSLTSGPFSNIGNAIFTPTQVTDAIGNNTSLLDGSGNVVATLLALQALLKGLDTYMNGNSNLANAVGSQISTSGGGLLLGWDVFDGSLSQNDAGSPSGNGTSYDGLHEVTSINSKSFTVPKTGYYLMTAEGNFGKNIGVSDTIGNTSILANVYTGSSGGTEVANSYMTTGWPSYPTEDLIVSGMVYLTTGTYHMRVGYQTETSNIGIFTGSVHGPAVNGFREA